MESSVISIELGNCMIEKFNPKLTNILKWQNNFEYIIDALDLKDDAKGKFLLHMVEPSVYTDIQLKVVPFDPSDLSYEVLISLLEQLYSTHQGEYAGNYRFLYRDQLTGESIPHYVLALRKISSKCSSNFKTNDSLKSRFIRGLLDQTIQISLENYKSLTFSKVVAIAQQMELYKLSHQIN